MLLIVAAITIAVMAQWRLSVCALTAGENDNDDDHRDDA